MASIRQHRGRLLIDYREGGSRQRVYTKLEDTPENRSALEDVARQVDAALTGNGNVKAVLESAGLLQRMPMVSTAPRAAAPPVSVAVERVSAPLFTSFSEQWFGEFKVGWRKSYIVTVRGILDQHLVPKLGVFQVNAITRAQILELRSHLSSLRGRRPGTTLSPARINTVMLILRQILQEAADRFEFTMPMGRLKPLKVPKSHVDPFTLDEAQLLITTVRPDYRQYMLVRFFTGMRSGELHGLKWKYVDFAARLIYVREAIVLGEDEYTKNDFSQRDIQMNQMVFDALQEQFKVTGTREYVFCNRAGEPIDLINFTKRVWYPLLRHLGLSDRRPYQTRHTAATLWLAAGETPEWIAKQLGHASTEMLFRRYSRFVPNLTRRDGSAIDRLLNARFGGGSEGQAETSGEGPKAQPPPLNFDRPV